MILGVFGLFHDVHYELNYLHMDLYDLWDYSHDPSITMQLATSTYQVLKIWTIILYNVYHFSVLTDWLSNWLVFYKVQVMQRNLFYELIPIL